MVGPMLARTGEGRGNRRDFGWNGGSRSRALGAAFAVSVAFGRTASADEAAPLPVTESSSEGPSANAAAPLELDDVHLEGVTEGARTPARSVDPRLEGLMLLHFADGFGAGGQLRLGAFGLRASVGYEPLLFIVDDDPQDRTFGDVEFSNSAQLNVDTLLFTKAEIGGSIGYRYNTLLGHGVAVAYQSMFDLWGQRFSFSIPLMYFPDATDRVREEHALSPDQRINFPFGAKVQYGIGVAWVL